MQRGGDAAAVITTCGVGARLLASIAKAQTEQVARAAPAGERVSARDRNARLGKVPEIGLVCLKAQPGHANPPLPNFGPAQRKRRDIPLH
jgi:hypothetical protein